MFGRVLNLLWLRFELYDSIMPLKFPMEHEQHCQHTDLHSCVPVTQRCFCMRKLSW